MSAQLFQKTGGEDGDAADGFYVRLRLGETTPPQPHPAPFMQPQDAELYIREVNRAGALAAVLATISHASPFVPMEVGEQYSNTLGQLLNEISDACGNMALVRQRALRRHVEPQDRPARKTRRKSVEEG